MIFTLYQIILHLIEAKIYATIIALFQNLNRYSRAIENKIERNYHTSKSHIRILTIK